MVFVSYQGRWTASNTHSDSSHMERILEKDERFVFNSCTWFTTSISSKVKAALQLIEILVSDSLKFMRQG